LLARSRRVEVTGPRGADGSLRADRFGRVAAAPRRTADGAYLVALLPDHSGDGGPATAAERVTVGLEHLALDWLDADAAPGEARRLGRRERLVEQTADGELVGRLLAEVGMDVDVDVTVDYTNADGDQGLPSHLHIASVSVIPLTRAAERGHLETVRLLLDAGADPDRMDGDGETPLTCAARKGRLEVLRLLLGPGAGVNSRTVPDLDRVDGAGATPLMIAAANGYMEMLRLLVVRGAAVGYAHPRDGCTAFHLACFHNTWSAPRRWCGRDATSASRITRATRDGGSQRSRGTQRWWSGCGRWWQICCGEGRGLRQRRIW
jgi:hypothetical protein